MKFELHCHSLNSRGSKIPCEATASPGEIVKVLKKKGFSGVAITDHDTIESWKEGMSAARKEGMVFIRGLEISSNDGHVIGLGLNEKIGRGLSLDETLDMIKRQGAISVAPHPFDLRSEGVGMGFRKCDASEVFNSLNLSRIENILARREIGKTKVSQVAGSDAHTPEMLGMSANIIDAKDEDEAISMIKKGKVSIEPKYTPIPMVVRWARVRMRRSHADIVKYIDKNYSRPRAAIAKLLLNMYTGSDSPLWYGLGYFSVGLSVAYSSIRNARSFL